MKPVKELKEIKQQPQPQGNQNISDEQAIQIVNRLKTQGNGAIITVDDVIGQLANLFVTIVNQKNKEIADLKEEMAKKEIEKKLDQKVK